MTEENRRRQCRLQWAKSQEFLEDTRILVEAERWTRAVSTLYYCLFHAVMALLVVEDLQPRTHEGVNRLFNLHFIRTGELPESLSRVFSRLQKYRGEADYAAEYQFGRDDVGREQRAVDDFLGRCRVHLVSRGWLSDV